MASYSIVDGLRLAPRLLQHEDRVQAGGEGIAQETENLELRRLVAILVNLLDPYGERARTTEGDIIQVTIDAARNALKEGK